MRDDGETRTGDPEFVVEGALKLAGVVKNWIPEELSMVVHGKEPLQYVDVWGGLNAAAWNRLAVNGKVTQSYLELAHKDISELEMVSTLMTRHTKEAVASWIAAMKDLGGEEAGNVAARLEAA